MGVGFIRDKLEIKFLILYIMARVGEGVPLVELQELTMCDEGIDYFDFAECLSDLVETEHLRFADERYCITPKGLHNSEICESSLPYSVRIRADKNLAEYRKLLIRRQQVYSGVTERENGTYTVTLRLRDEVDSVMELELMVATEEMAADLARRFSQNPEQVYTAMLSALYGQE